MNPFRLFYLVNYVVNYWSLTFVSIHLIESCFVPYLNKQKRLLGEILVNTVPCQPLHSYRHSCCKHNSLSVFILHFKVLWQHCNILSFLNISFIRLVKVGSGQVSSVQLHKNEILIVLESCTTSANTLY